MAVKMAVVEMQTRITCKPANQGGHATALTIREDGASFYWVGIGRKEIDYASLDELLENLCGFVEGSLERSGPDVEAMLGECVIDGDGSNRSTVRFTVLRTKPEREGKK